MLHSCPLPQSHRFGSFYKGHWNKVKSSSLQRPGQGLSMWATVAAAYVIVLPFGIAGAEKLKNRKCRTLFLHHRARDYLSSTRTQSTVKSFTLAEPLAALAHRKLLLRPLCYCPAFCQCSTREWQWNTMMHSHPQPQNQTVTSSYGGHGHNVMSSILAKPWAGAAHVYSSACRTVCCPAFCNCRPRQGQDRTVARTLPFLQRCSAVDFSSFLQRPWPKDKEAQQTSAWSATRFHRHPESPLIQGLCHKGRSMLLALCVWNCPEMNFSDSQTFGASAVCHLSGELSYTFYFLSLFPPCI